MLTVKIDAFEGPLDLLLHLIEQAEVDIYDISVAEIANQYIDFIHDMQELELEVASEYLVMAATLLALKSRMLLPKQEETVLDPLFDSEYDEIDTREELIERLIEYKKYKQLAVRLREKEVERSHIYTRPAENLSIYLAEEEVNPVENISLYHLLDVFYHVLTKQKAEPLATIERDEISIEKKMAEITELLVSNQHVYFSHLLQHVQHRSEIIATFLAVLELIKKKQIICYQEKLFDEISIVSYIRNELHGS